MSDAIIKIVVGLALTVISFVSYGWALSTLWGWFIVPVLAVKAISVVQGIGLGLVASLLKIRYENPEGDGLERAFFGCAAPVVVVGISWIVKGFM